MKLIFLTFYLILISTCEQDNKLDMLCQKWRQVGIKNFGKEYKPVDVPMAEILIIKKDGTYEEILYGNLQIKGQWKFSSDSSKLAFAVIEMNGTVTPDLSLDETKPTDSIIKLTSDTLVYGRLAYFGKEKTNGHDDWYFVREK